MQSITVHVIDFYFPNYLVHVLVCTFSSALANIRRQRRLLLLISQTTPLRKVSMVAIPEDE